VRLSVTLSVSRRVSVPLSLLTTDPGLVGFMTGPFEAQIVARRSSLAP
jgi:hypothetical protein